MQHQGSLYFAACWAITVQHLKWTKLIHFNIWNGLKWSTSNACLFFSFWLCWKSLPISFSMLFFTFFTFLLKFEQQISLVATKIIYPILSLVAVSWEKFYAARSLSWRMKYEHVFLCFDVTHNCLRNVLVGLSDTYVIKACVMECFYNECTVQDSLQIPYLPRICCEINKNTRVPHELQ